MAMVSAKMNIVEMQKPPYCISGKSKIEDLFATDSGMDIFGVLHIVRDGVLFEKQNNLMNNFEVRLLDAPRSLIERRQLKFRYGSCFAKSGSMILKYNKVTSRWEIVLSSPRPFSSFEITFDGQIILFGTFARVSQGQKHLPMTLKRDDLESGAQIEVWESLGNDPIISFPYDSEDKSLVKMVEGLPSYNRTWIYFGKIIFYNDCTGRMGIYDIAGRTIKWVKTPWDGLTTDGIRLWEKQSKKIDIKGDKQIYIDLFDVPLEGGMQLCPSVGSLKIVSYRIFRPVESHKPLNELNAASDVKPGVKLPQPVSPDSHQGKIGIGTLDLEKGEISQDQILDPPSSGVFWVNQDGNLMLLDAFLKPSKGDTSAK